MSFFKQLETIKVHISSVQSNLEDLENKSRKASAPKARKSIQECRKLLFDLRKSIMAHVKNIPIKSRPVKVKVSEVDVSKVDVPKPEKVVLKPVMKKPINKLEILKQSTNPTVFSKPIVRK